MSYQTKRRPLVRLPGSFYFCDYAKWADSILRAGSLWLGGKWSTSWCASSGENIQSVGPVGKALDSTLRMASLDPWEWQASGIKSGSTPKIHSRMNGTVDWAIVFHYLGRSLMNEKWEFSRQESSFCIGSRAGESFLLVRILGWLPNPSSTGKKKDCIAMLKRSSIEYQQRRTIRALVDGTHRCRIKPLSLTASQLGRRSFGKRNFRWADSVF